MFFKYFFAGLCVFLKSFQSCALSITNTVAICSDNHDHRKIIETIASKKSVKVCIFNGDIINRYDGKGRVVNTGHMRAIRTFLKILKANPHVLIIWNLGNHDAFKRSFVDKNIHNLLDLCNEIKKRSNNIVLLNSHLSLDKRIQTSVFHDGVLYVGFMTSDLGKESHQFKKYLPTWYQTAIQKESNIICNEVRNRFYKKNRVKRVVFLNHAGDQESKGLVKAILKHIKYHDSKVFAQIQNNKIKIASVTGHVHSKTHQEKSSFGTWSFTGIRVPHIYPGSFDSVVRTRF